MVHSTLSKEHPPSSSLLHMLLRPASVTLIHLPPAADRDARRLQNFFPFPHLLEKEEVLETKDPFLNEVFKEDGGSKHLKVNFNLDEDGEWIAASKRKTVDTFQKSQLYW